MAFAIGAVRRHGKLGIVGGRLRSGDGIEDEQHLLADAVEHMAPLRLGERLEPQRAAIEIFDGAEVARVKNGLEYGGWLHVQSGSGQ